MRKIWQILLIILVIFLFLPAGPAKSTLIWRSSVPGLINPVIINFDSQTKGTYTSLTIGDVTFQANDLNFRMDDTYVGSYYGLSGLYLDNGPSAGGFHSITFDFANPVSGFAFKMGWGNHEWLLAAYDPSDNLIEEYYLSFDGSAEHGLYFGILANNIAKAEFGFYQDIWGSSTNDWISFDNFTYSPSAVIPIPGSLLLLGTGVLCLAAYRRRKQG